MAEMNYKGEVRQIKSELLCFLGHPSGAYPENEDVLDPPEILSIMHGVGVYLKNFIQAILSRFGDPSESVRGQFLKK